MFKKILLFCLMLGLASPAIAGLDFYLNSKDLISRAKELDGMVVVLKGEVIGDIMPRGQNVWINIQDKTGSMSVWATRDQAALIKFKGDYGHRGDMVEVKGRFVRSDPELGGELCVRAESLKVVAIGNFIIHPINQMKVKLSQILLVLSVALIVLRLVIKRRKREV